MPSPAGTAALSTRANAACNTEAALGIQASIPDKELARYEEKGSA